MYEMWLARDMVDGGNGNKHILLQEYKHRAASGTHSIKAPQTSQQKENTM